LNHLGIAQIYGVIETPDLPEAHVHALVMELVEGEDLAERLVRGAVPPDEALPIARQIAEALDAAHEVGIVHRDLKPANIKVRPDGTVKVLDFGLAKATDVGGVSGTDLTNSPTVTAPATQVGVILGTAAYMAPEQASGKSADRRADIWAFGAVLYEMLAGRPLFTGECVTEVLAAVLRADIPWSALPPSTPASVRRLLRHCLERDPKKRLSAIGDARFDLDEAKNTPPARQVAASAAASQGSWWKRITLVIAVTIATGVITGAIVWNTRPNVTPEVVRFAVTLGPYQVHAQLARNTLAVSPDGRRLAYVVDRQLVLRNLAEIDGHPISGSADPQAIFGPVFSPDGESIAYYALGEKALRRIPVGGGAALTVCSTESPLGLAWNGDNLYFGTSAGLMEVPASGGTPEKIVPIRPGDREQLFGPRLLPGGKALLYTSAAGGDFATAGKIVVQLLASGERTVVADGGAADARYLSTGHILYAKGGIVYAVAFDAAAMKTHGVPVPVIEGVRLSEDLAAMDLSVSDSGTLVYVPGQRSGHDLNLAFFSRGGIIEPLAIPPGSYADPRLSPDGKQVAVSKTEAGGGRAIWVAEVSGATAPRQLTFEGISQYPVWSPDGLRVTFQSQRADDRSIFRKRADGAGPAEQLTHADKGTSHVPQSWSPDGRYLLFDVVRDKAVSLWAYSVPDKKIHEVPTGYSTAPTTAVFSPDGRWVAYTTQESNMANAQVYVQPFPATGAKYLISDPNEDGHHAVWSRDGRELLYTPGPGNRIQRVVVSTATSFQYSRPELLARRFTNASPSFQRPYDMAGDGRFLALIEAGALKESSLPTSQVVVVLNWFEELKRLVHTN
jgi:Tol biopolymer transport system component